MEDIKKTIQNEIEKIWPQAKKNISKLSKDTTKLLKKSEKELTIISKKIKTGVEQLVNKAKREELYRELGKYVTPLLTSDQLKNKNVMRIYSEIQQINKNLKKK